jgi:hypothetical protein
MIRGEKGEQRTQGLEPLGASHPRREGSFEKNTGFLASQIESAPYWQVSQIIAKELDVITKLQHTMKGLSRK